MLFPQFLFCLNLISSNKYYPLQIIAYYTLDEIQNADYYFYSHIALDSEKEFNEFITKIKENSYFDTGLTAEYGDKLLTLSTYDYWVDDARLLIIAKKYSEKRF